MKQGTKRATFATCVTVGIIGYILLGLYIFQLIRDSEAHAAELTTQNERLTEQNGELAEEVLAISASRLALASANEQLTDELAEAHAKQEETTASLKNTEEMLEASKTEAAKAEDKRQALANQVHALKQELDALKKTKAAAVGKAPSGGSKTAQAPSKKQSPPKAAQSSSTGSGAVVGSNFEVTWYNVTGTTRSGKQTVDGVTVAVDPNVIPLGSLIRITFPDGTVYTREAHDTGGAVKGHIVDIYSSASTGELLKRGRTHGVKVEILRRGW